MAGQSSEMLRTSSVIKVPDIANCAPTLANKCKRLKQNTRVINFDAIDNVPGSAMYAVEYSSVRQRTFFSKGFARGMPKWVVRSIKLLALFFAVHLVLFVTQSHASVPEIRNGEYVLNDHGKIVKTLTQSEFYKLKGAELRLFATEWMFFYFVPTAYWWFPRTEQETIGNLGINRV
jgi:hypothetical protein